MTKASSYLKKSSLEDDIHQDMAMKAPKVMLLILKSLNSDNLRGRLKESIEALSFFCSSEHMPVKEALEGEQSR